MDLEYVISIIQNKRLSNLILKMCGGKIIADLLMYGKNSIFARILWASNDAFLFLNGSKAGPFV